MKLQKRDMRRALHRWRDTLSNYHTLKQLTASVSKKLRIRKLRRAFNTYKLVYQNYIREQWAIGKAQIMHKQLEFRSV